MLKHANRADVCVKIPKILAAPLEFIAESGPKTTLSSENLHTGSKFSQFAIGNKKIVNHKLRISTPPLSSTHRNF